VKLGRDSGYSRDMPHVLIEIRREASEAEETALIDAVHGALIRAFRVPESDRHLRLLAHPPHRFAVPPGLAHPERFTQISIDAFAGRSLDAKRALYAAIVKSLEPLGVPRDHVSILVRDAPRENWGIRGGQAASDVDLGFDVNV
jgi:phenylpyruvate tautomerase PptA (4-oxalocrotonate tautomerase family)